MTDASSQGGIEQNPCRTVPLKRGTCPQPCASQCVDQYVASKFTAAVLPPLMITATRSPAIGL